VQIFVTSPDPDICAAALDDSRVVKQVLEGVQMLCTVAHLEGHIMPYKPSHPHNGLIRWLQNDRANVYWLIRHTMALKYEYNERFNRTHGSEEVLHDCMKIFGYDKERKVQAFINKAANKEHKLDFMHIQDVFTAYRLYLSARWEKAEADHDLGVLLGLARKPRKPKWTNKLPPNWYMETQNV
jgi:hypothetical protein